MMSSTVTESLKSIVDGYGFSFGIVVSTSGQELARCGDTKSLRWRGLLSLFADEDAIVTLAQSLEDRILPQIHSQGEVRCLILKPTPDLLVGLYKAGDDFQKLYQDGKSITAKLSREWAEE